jgi:hypothetical protein
MSVTLLEIMAAAHLRKASLAAEVAGYLALGVADQVLGAPRRPGPRDVMLGRDGALRVTGGAPASETDAETTLRELLLSLLEQASSVTPALVRSGKRPAQNGVEALIRELETALIPVNRGAAKRALARLYRDVNRARESGIALDFEVAGRRPQTAVKSPVPPVVVKSVELPDVLFAAEPSVAPALVAPVAPVAPMPAPLPVVPITPPEPAQELVTLEPANVEIPVDIIVSPTPPPMEVDVELDIVTDELIFAPPAPPLVPAVPDLLPAVVPSEAPKNEPATVPQPVVRRHRAEVAQSRTPTVGSFVEPGLVLSDADITDPVPSAEAPSVTWEDAPPDTPHTEPVRERTLTLPPVEVAPVVRVVAPTPVMPVVEPTPAPMVEPSPVPEPVMEHTQLLPPVVVVEPVAHDGGLVLESPEEEDAIPFELTSRTPPRAELVSYFDDEPPALTESGELAQVDDAWDAADEEVRLQVLEPLPDIDLHSLQTLADLPPRPLPDGHAAPRYAPRRSDVDELVSGFGIGEKHSDRDLCRDLKLLAGIEATSPPPVVSLSETPPPVVDMGEDGAAPSEASSPGSPRAAIVGAALVALVVAGVGIGSIPLHAAPRSDTRAVAAQPVAAVRMGESRREAPCSAEIDVTDVPQRARVELRAGPDQQKILPTRAAAHGPVFANLPCREAVDVMLELPGRRWLRVPVAASELTPSDEEPSFVRHSVAVR